MSQAAQVIGPQPTTTLEDATELTIQPPAGAQRAAASMARSAIIVGLAFVMSRILGLAREVILANKFATGPQMDAYVSAFKIPDLLFLVVMAGSFGAAFIPIFGEYLANGDQDRAWRLASSVLTWAGIGVVAMSLVCFALARPLMYVVAPGFDRETADLAVNLMRILLLSPVFLGFGIASKGMLEAHHEFTLPALAPLVYNFAIIVGALFFVDRYGIYAVGWAVIFGAVGHFLVQVPGLMRAGIKFRPTIDRHVDGLREVAMLLGPRVIGLAAFQFNFIAVNAFASRSDIEHVSAINYAWQLLMLPHGVLALSISTVIFPTLATLYSQKRGNEFRATLDRGMRPLLFLSIPSSVGLFLLREPIIRVLYQSGEFGSSSTELVAAPLAWFAIGLVGYALTEILTRVFYATRDTRTPVVTGVLTVILNIVLCILLGGAIGYQGLTLALSATTAAEAVILALFLRTRIGHVVTAGFWIWLRKVAIAAGIMAAVIVITRGKLEAILSGSAGDGITGYLIFGYAMAIYAGTFLILAWVLKIPELTTGINRVGGRLPGPLRHPLQRIGRIES